MSDSSIITTARNHSNLISSLLPLEEINFNGGTIKVSISTVELDAKLDSIPVEDSGSSKLSSMLSSSSPSLSMSSYESPSFNVPLYEGVDLNKKPLSKVAKPNDKKSDDYKKIQSELNLYNALTNLYNASKRIESQKKNREKQRETHNKSVGPNGKSENNHEKSENGSKLTRSTSLRKKSETVDDFQFPIYTGLIFRSKKIPAEKERTQKVERTEVLQGQPEVITKSIEEIEIKLEKNTKSSIETPILSTNSEAEKANQKKSNEKNLIIDNNLNNVALKYLLAKSASKIKSSESCKKEKSNKLGHRTEKGKPLAKYVASPHIERLVENILNPMSKIHQAHTQQQEIFQTPTISSTIFQKTSSLKKRNLENHENGMNSPSNSLQTTKKKLVTFKLPEQIISYTKPKSAGSYLRSYRTSRSNENQNKNYHNPQSHNYYPMYDNHKDNRSSYYGGSTLGYAQQFNQNTSKHRYSGLFDYTNKYGNIYYDQNSIPSSSQSNDFMKLYPYSNNDSYRLSQIASLSSPSIINYSRPASTVGFRY